MDNVGSTVLVFSERVGTVKTAMSILLVVYSDR
jgi:hypothetical protein